ncbi:hypothetical protein RB653_003311 (mitochondrion) [Dictyostelium firmibasis]|uniref:Uncharacterized protein n=1 Tax=Dictyostelium firmibasis TaxID=79012 RepID=A0AAN7TJH4_9MYCE
MKVTKKNFTKKRGVQTKQVIFSKKNGSYKNPINAKSAQNIVKKLPLSAYLRLVKARFFKNDTLKLTDILTTSMNRPQVLNIKEMGSAIDEGDSSKRIVAFNTPVKAVDYKVNLENVRPVERVLIKNINFPLKLKSLKETNQIGVVLKDEVSSLRSSRLHLLKVSYELQKRALNRKAVGVSYKKKIQNSRKSSLLTQLVLLKKREQQKQKRIRSLKTTVTSYATQRAMHLGRNEVAALQKKSKKKVGKLIRELTQKQRRLIKVKQKEERFKKQRYVFLKSKALPDYEKVLPLYFEIAREQDAYWKKRQEQYGKKRNKKKWVPRTKVQKKIVEKKLKRSKIRNEKKEQKIPGQLNTLKRLQQSNIEKILNNYKEPFTSTSRAIENRYITIESYLNETQQRTQIQLRKTITKQKELVKNKRVVEKHKKNVKIQIAKKLLTLVLKKQEKQEEIKKELIIKLILNILRGKGAANAEGKDTGLYQYLRGIKELLECKAQTVEYIDENMKMRLIQEVLPYKKLATIVETTQELLKKRIEVFRVENEKPRKRVEAKIYKAYKDKFVTKIREYAKVAKKRYRQYGKNIRNRYNILNNIIAEESQVYNLRLPKQRVKVPSLYKIYKMVRKNELSTYRRNRKRKVTPYLLKKKLRTIYNKIQFLKRQAIRDEKARLKGKKVPIRNVGAKKGKKRRKIEKKALRQGVLKIKLKRRNMFLVFQNLRTKKVEAVFSARQEYYRIFNSREPEAITQKRKKEMKSTALKPKGPIGRYISTEIFRRRVITQALLNLRHIVNYNVLDIELKKRTKHPIVKTILYKNWYVYSNEGLLRMYKFTKNKAHGSMRKKKRRRI